MPKRKAGEGAGPVTATVWRRGDSGDQRRKPGTATAVGSRLNASAQTTRRASPYTSSTRASPIWRFSDEKFIPMSVMRLPDARYFSA